MTTTAVNLLQTSEGHSLTLCDASSAAFTIVLPAASSSTGRILHFKKTDSSANAVTIDGSGSETIDDAATATLAAQYDCKTITSDGTEWWVL